MKWILSKYRRHPIKSAKCPVMGSVSISTLFSFRLLTERQKTATLYQANEADKAVQGWGAELTKCLGVGGFLTGIQLAASVVLQTTHEHKAGSLCKRRWAMITPANAGWWPLVGRENPLKRRPHEQVFTLKVFLDKLGKNDKSFSPCWKASVPAF